MDNTDVARGLRWGIVATIVMSIPMVAATLTGLAPMPRPIPVAIIGKLLDGGLSTSALAILATASHLAYGGVWGAILAAATPPVTIGKGLGLGVFLWLLMNVAVLPWLGWGLFGRAVTLRIAVVTLILHLIYGAAYGWLMDRDRLNAEIQRLRRAA